MSEKREYELVAKLIDAAMELAHYRLRMGKLREEPVAEEVLPAWIVPYLDTARLCYIDSDSRVMHFTTREPFVKQWGDDWDDAPYDCNAGTPYGFIECDREKGRTPWELFAVGFTSELVTPAQNASGNCQLSVQQINGGAAPWLGPSRWSKGGADRIWGGDTLRRIHEVLRSRNEALAIPPSKPEVFP